MDHLANMKRHIYAAHEKPFEEKPTFEPSIKEE